MAKQIQKGKGQASAEALADPTASLKLIRGNQLGRMAGLEPLEHLAPGRSILDVGSHRGLISYELAKYAPSLIHGFDIYQRGIDTSREIFADIELPSEFHVANLSLGLDEFQSQFGDILLPQYDIVLMLAVFQHIKKQMDGEELKRLMEYFTDVCGRYFVLRAPNIEQLDDFIIGKGFKLIYYYYVEQNLTPVVIYERVN